MTYKRIIRSRFFRLVFFFSIGVFSASGCAKNLQCTGENCPVAGTAPPVEETPADHPVVPVPSPDGDQNPELECKSYTVLRNRELGLSQRLKSDSQSRIEQDLEFTKVIRLSEVSAFMTIRSYGAVTLTIYLFTPLDTVGGELSHVTREVFPGTDWIRFTWASPNEPVEIEANQRILLSFSSTTPVDFFYSLEDAISPGIFRWITSHGQQKTSALRDLNFIINGCKD